MTPDIIEKSNALSHKIIGAAIEVHRHLGPGLYERPYQACLAKELQLRGIPFERELPVPLNYKGLEIDEGYRLDIIVGNLVIVEAKAVKELTATHDDAQLMTYLRLKNLWLGLLINFNVVVLKDGIKRIVCG